MPVPIRPVRDLEDNIPSALKDGGFSAMGLSEMQIKMLGLADIKRESAKKIMIDSRDAEILQEIWAKQDELKLAQNEDIKKTVMNVPESIPERDIIRMKTNGLVIGPDNKNISLTSRGEKVLKDKILSSESLHFLNRTKESFDFYKESKKLVKISEI